MTKYFYSLSDRQLFERRGNVSFIVFEGPDGAGQSTQANLLTAYLENQGRGVILTKEPTLDSDAGRRIKEVLNKQAVIESAKLQELFVQDRKEHLEKLIIPSLQAGKFVISDRYFFSTFAYGAINCDLERLIKINQDFIAPDITFILATSPEICLERIGKRGRDRQFFEKLETLKKVLENYKALVSRFKNVYLIDGEKSIEEVFGDVIMVVEDKF